MIYGLFLLKRFIEDLFIRPFILLGRRKARKLPLLKNYDFYFFFPFFHTGGAEKVHAQIAMAFRGKKALIIFTRRSHDEGFRALFSASGHDVIDISAYTDKKSAYWNNLIWRGVVSGHINSQPTKPVVFNGQCNFAYKCAPWIDKEVCQYELIHSFNSFSRIRIPFITCYKLTVMISRKAMDDHREQYSRLGMPDDMHARMRYIRNGIPIPTDALPRHTSSRKLNILYAGRGTREKRVHIVARIAEQCRAEKLPVDFTFMGDVSEGLREYPALQARMLGNITDPQGIARIYDETDVLILTSSEEGFPMVVMEAMARGCIIIATPVGDLPAHIRQGEEGFLLSSVQHEDTIVIEAVIMIRKLLGNPLLCHRISAHNISYAQDHFSLRTFEESYRKLLTPETNAQ
jgi:glycosyltransferase involved in cell wall biosynthesis